MHSRTDSDKSRPEWADYYTLLHQRGKVQLDNQQLGVGWDRFITGSQQSYWHTDERILVAGGIQRYAGGDCMERFYNNNKIRRRCGARSNFRAEYLGAAKSMAATR